MYGAAQNMYDGTVAGNNTLIQRYRHRLHVGRRRSTLWRRDLADCSYR